MCAVKDAALKAGAFQLSTTMKYLLAICGQLHHLPTIVMAKRMRRNIPLPDRARFECLERIGNFTLFVDCLFTGLPPTQTALAFFEPPFPIASVGLIRSFGAWPLSTKYSNFYQWAEKILLLLRTFDINNI